MDRPGWSEEATPTAFLFNALVAFLFGFATDGLLDDYPHRAWRALFSPGLPPETRDDVLALREDLVALVPFSGASGFAGRALRHYAADILRTADYSFSRKEPVSQSELPRDAAMGRALADLYLSVWLPFVGANAPNQRDGPISRLVGLSGAAYFLIESASDSWYSSDGRIRAAMYATVFDCFPFGWEPVLGKTLREHCEDFVTRRGVALANLG